MSSICSINTTSRRRTCTRALAIARRSQAPHTRRSQYIHIHRHHRHPTITAIATTTTTTISTTSPPPRSYATALHAQQPHRQDPAVVATVKERILSEALTGDDAHDRITTGESARSLHGQDVSYHAPQLPDLVVFPRSVDEVSAIHRICHEHSLPIVPFGTGTSLEGHVLAVHGGLSLDMSRMDRIVEVNAEDMDVTVEAGVTREQLNDHIRESGLFFPIDPGANATIGGMASTRASGTNAVRYGTMRDNVLRLKVVMPNGDVVTTSRRARKSSAGYDLTRLFVGSEGTLGTICEITLRLHGIPESISAAVCSFPDVTSAAQSVIQLIQYGVPIARVELMDETCVRAVNKYSHLSYEERPTLFFEFHGTEGGVQEQAEIAQEIARDNGGRDFQWATDPESRNRLWKARHQAYFASLALKPGCKALTTDVCVPISKLDQCIAETKSDMDQTGLTYTLVGHVGDGNFHCIICMDPDSPQDLQKTKEANDRLVHRALSFGGTCTGEHGVGIGKISYMLSEHGVENIRVQRAIKAALDPKNIMNPGKLHPTESDIIQFELAQRRKAE